MNIWPWSKIKERENAEQKWFQAYLDIYKSRIQVLAYLDSVEPGRHVCVADVLYVFKPEGVWEVVSPKNGQEGL